MEQRNRRETEPKHKKTRREIEIIKGKHFNLKSVSESFRCVLVFVVKQNNFETILKQILNQSVFLSLFFHFPSSFFFVFWFCFSSVSLFHFFKNNYWSINIFDKTTFTSVLLLFHFHFSLPTLAHFSYTPTLCTHIFFNDSAPHVFKCFSK